MSCEVDDEVVILDTGAGLYYGLEPVGARIWQLIREPIELASLVRIIVKEFEVDERRCEQDSITFLAQLRDKGLITVTNPS